MTSDGNDESLLRAALAGDLTAYERLVLLVERSVFRLCYLLVRDERDATKMARSVLAGAFAELPNAQAPAFLIGVLRQVMQHPRARQIWERSHTDVSQPTIGRQISPEVAIIGGADNRLTAQALDDLSGPDQISIYLRYFLQLSPVESAAVLGMSDEQWREQVSGALDRLSLKLADMRQLAPEHSR